MNIKLLILLLTTLLTFPSIGQSLKVDTFKTSQVDTGLLIRWQCHAGQSDLSKDNYPLIIINSRTFKNCLLQNIFFDLDTTTISTVQILNPKNDSIKLYGKAGRNGVIIITTRRPILWISAKHILRQNSNAILNHHDRTLIRVDNVLFDTTEELYFQKDLIQNVSVSNMTQHYIDKKYNSVVSINLTKKSGT